MKKIISTIFIFTLLITAFISLQKVEAQTIGDVLTGHYTYYDPEGDPEGVSMYQWYRDNTPISGATNLTYTVTSNDAGHTLYFQVTPVALTGISPGTPIMSSGIVIEAIPVSSGGGSGSGGGILPIVPAGTSTVVITYLSSSSTIATSTTASTTVTVNNLGSVISKIARLLKLGMSGVDVKAIQTYLNNNGYIIAKSGVGSPGRETNYFGPATKAAVIKFQKANKIVPVTGNVGPLTLAKMKQ